MVLSGVEDVRTLSDCLVVLLVRLCSSSDLDAVFPHGWRHPVDKIVNLLLGCFLPLEKAVAGSTEDVRLKLLSDCRKAHEKMSKSYEKNVKGTWKVEERELPRRHGQGGPIQVAVHEPLERGARQDLPLIVWAHGGGCMLKC